MTGQITDISKIAVRLMGFSYSHDHPLSGWHVLPLEGDITCLRPEGALKSANSPHLQQPPNWGLFQCFLTPA